MNEVATTNQTQIATQSMDMASQIVAMASNPDFDVAKLEKLMELQERVANQQSIIAFNQDFSVMQSKLPIIAKNKKGQSNKYATLEDIIANTRPILQEFGFATSFETETALNENKNNCFVKVVAVLTHRMGHSTRTSLLVPFDFSGNKTANYAQAMGSAVSYGKRYALCALLNIATQDDDDRNSTTSEFITSEQKKYLQSLYGRLSDDDKFKFDGMMFDNIGSTNFGKIHKTNFQIVMAELQRMLGATNANP